VLPSRQVHRCERVPQVVEPNGTQTQCLAGRPPTGDDAVVGGAQHRDQPKQPHTEESNGTEAAHLFVSVAGAAWLLMGQLGVTETRSIADALQRA
jgi:hypothetical protein